MRIWREPQQKIFGIPIRSSTPADAEMELNEMIKEDWRKLHNDRLNNFHRPFTKYC